MALPPSAFIARQLNQGMTYVRLTSFDWPEASFPIQAEAALRLAGRSQSIILDLRSNSGGSLLNAASLAGKFGVQGQLAKIRSKSGETEVINATFERTLPQGISVAVLLTPRPVPRQRW